MNQNRITAPQTGAPTRATVIAPNNAAADFKSFYTNGVALPRLKENTEYKATLQAHKFVEPATINDKPYVRLELKLSDRLVIDNRFQTGFQILINQMIRQYGWEDETHPVQEILSKMSSEEFSLWVSYVTGEDGRVYRNFNFLPPLAQKKVEATAAETEETEDELPL
ncbi:MAG: hypothetical protein KBA53_13595 [Thermoclostridium sp.]|nr:hypothetical protein [Thermoclostridium sp.]